MPDLHFTKTAIANLPTPPAGKRVWYHDTDTRFLAVRVFSTGNRAFYHYRWVNGKPQQKKLGDFPDLSLLDARREAEKLNGAIAAGADPAAERAQAREERTLDALLTWYEAHHGARKKSGGRDRRQLQLYFPELLPMKLSAITRSQVRQLHARCGAAPDERVKKKARTYSANRALAVLRSVFARAIEDDEFAGPNPAEGVRFHPEKSRARRLESDEIGRFLAAVDQAPEVVRDYILMSLFTAQRRSNVLAMRWDQIDFKVGEWRIPVTKNGDPLVVALEEQELKILLNRWERSTSEWVFPGRVNKSGKDLGRTGHLYNPWRSWNNILKAANMEDFRLHDLRRTMGSILADSGVSLQIIGKTLGHKSHAATLVYARLSLDPVRVAKRGALEALEAARRR